MKTNNKLLLGVGLIMLFLLVVVLVILRNSFNTIHYLAKVKNNFSEVTINGQFNKLEFASHWNVKVRRGRESKVEVVMNNNSTLKPVFKVVDGTLYCMADTINSISGNDSIVARITMQDINSLKASNGTFVHMEFLTTDSIQIILNDGCKFVSNSNTLKKAIYTIDGKVEMKVIQPL